MTSARLWAAVSCKTTREIFSSRGINNINHSSPKLIYIHAWSRNQNHLAQHFLWKWKWKHAQLLEEMEQSSRFFGEATLSRGDEAPGGRMQRVDESDHLLCLDQASKPNCRAQSQGCQSAPDDYSHDGFWKVDVFLAAVRCAMRTIVRAAAWRDFMLTRLHANT